MEQTQAATHDQQDIPLAEIAADMGNQILGILALGNRDATSSQSRGKGHASDRLRALPIGIDVEKQHLVSQSKALDEFFLQPLHPGV